MARARLLASAAVAALAAAGCVERKLWIRTDPEGAEVRVNGRAMGPSPVEMPFSFYGVVRVEAEAPGHRRAETDVDLRAPWYEFFPFDFFSENLLPWTVVDEHHAVLRLQPVPPLDEEGIRRAKEEADRVKARGERERRALGGEGPR